MPQLTLNTIFQSGGRYFKVHAIGGQGTTDLLFIHECNKVSRGNIIIYEQSHDIFEKPAAEMNESLRNNKIEIIK